MMTEDADRLVHAGARSHERLLERGHQLGGGDFGHGYAGIERVGHEAEVERGQRALAPGE